MKSLSPYLVKFSGLKEGVHLFDFEIGNKFFKNFDYYDFADANIKTILELEKKPTLLNLKFRFNGEVEVQCDLSMEMFSLELETDYTVVVKFKDDTISSDDKVIFLPTSSFKRSTDKIIPFSTLCCLPPVSITAYII